jgi:hypothetical protein
MVNVVSAYHRPQPPEGSCELSAQQLGVIHCLEFGSSRALAAYLNGCRPSDIEIWRKHSPRFAWKLRVAESAAKRNFGPPPKPEPSFFFSDGRSDHPRHPFFD